MKKVISILICSVLVFSMGSFNALANTDTEVGVVESLDFSNLVGNSIRSEGKQGLRFKYSVDETSYNIYTSDGYTVDEIGVLAMRDSFLDGDELVIDGVYNNNRANIGVFYSSAKSINNLSQDNIASAVLINIGFNVNTHIYDFSAYAENYTTRMYIILSKDDNTVMLYDTEEKASVVDIMKAIIDKYEATTTPDEQLIADYQSVQNLLNSTDTDKNGKTVKEIYYAKYPAKPAAPTESSKTDTTVTLTAVSGYEYKMNDGEWQTSNIFTGLSPATQYSFYQRVAETNSAYASASSDALVVTTDKSTPAKPSAPTEASKTDTTITLTKVDGYEYSKDGITWQTSNIFTDLSPATQYSFYQRVAATDSSYASESSDALTVTTNSATSSEDDGWTGDYIINTKPR